MTASTHPAPPWQSRTSVCRRGSLAGLVLLVVSFTLAWPVADAGAVTPGLAEGDAGRMVLVLDSSGSMKERASGGETKIAAAKRALSQVIGSLPPAQSVGLRVYGATVFSRDQAGACTDSQLVVPVGTDNRADLRSAVSRYRPYGETPIGYALQQAGKDLGSQGRRTIVLVSDGEPTCDPDPCKVARELSAQGVDLKIDVVGLDVDGAARQKLQCIAGAGNGTYYDVDSSEEFATSLEKLATRAGRPFAAVGDPVRGTPTADGAPTLVAGDWLDDLGTSENALVKHYEVQREVPGSTLHVSASLRTATSDGESVTVATSTPEGELCDSASDFAQLSVGRLISAGAATGGTDAADEDPCVTADTLLVTVTDDVRSVRGPRPLELRVIEEPPVASTDNLPQATDGTFRRPSAGRSRKAVGGSSFLDATVLTPGSYRDGILPGELLTYQVDVDWGQQLTARVDFPPPGEKLAEATGNLDLTSLVDLFSPGRAKASDLTLDGSPANQGFLPTSASSFSVGTSPVTYLSREGSDATGDHSMAGRYTVAVFLEEDPEGQSYVVPFTLHLAVTGKVSGAPDYTEEPAPLEPSPSASPSATDSSAPPADPSPSTQTTPTAADGDGGGGIEAGYVVGGLGVVALLGAAFLVLSNRRATSGG